MEQTTHSIHNAYSESSSELSLPLSLSSSFSYLLLFAPSTTCFLSLWYSCSCCATLSRIFFAAGSLRPSTRSLMFYLFSGFDGSGGSSCLLLSIMKQPYR